MPEKILIVDDQVDTATLLAIALKRAGYAVLQAHNGQAALQLALSEKPDLIILDVMMPDMSGFEVLKALDTTSQAIPPVILFTAKDEVEDVVKGMAAGAHSYLVKPTSREKLLETVKTALSEKK
jgi:DNA-binding response OmpR family regulator